MLCYVMLSHFSRVRLCATPETATHQASPSLGFSRQEHWSGLPFPSPLHESEKWKWSRSVVSDSSDPMDCSLPGSSVHGVFQAKELEWGAIAFSGDQLYMDLFFFKFFSHLGCYRVLSSVPLLYSRSSVVIYFIYSSVYMSIPNFHCISPSHPSPQ